CCRSNDNTGGTSVKDRVAAFALMAAAGTIVSCSPRVSDGDPRDQGFNGHGWIRREHRRAVPHSLRLSRRTPHLQGKARPQEQRRPSATRWPADVTATLSAGVMDNILLGSWSLVRGHLAVPGPKSGPLSDDASPAQCSRDVPSGSTRNSRHQI